MSRLIFDIETNGLLDQLDTIHSLVIHDLDTRRTVSCNEFEPDAPGIQFGVDMLMEADRIIGHNIIKFDIPAIQKVHPEFFIAQSKVTDTLVMSRLIWGDLYERDWVKINKGRTRLTGKLAGSHGLEAWGIRLGQWKGDYSKDCKEQGIDPWAAWNEPMQRYCEQDVVVNKALHDLISGLPVSQEAIELEHAVAFICAEQERNGFGFDADAAVDLYMDLMVQHAKLVDSLAGIFPPWFVRNGAEKTFKKDTRLKSGERRTAGSTYQPVKVNVFNPGSRDQVADRLIKVKGWKPTEFTPTGKPEINETILSALPWEEAQSLAELFKIKKLMSQIADGKGAWLGFATDEGRIHGSINTNGAVTGRATHSHPNLAQVPSVKKFKGKECRALFGPLSADDFQLGCDVSGLELRMLGHFMARYDGGAYAREVINGDIHWVNTLALGLVEGERDEENPFHKLCREGAKTFIYAFLYGAGDIKIGSIILEMGIAERNTLGTNSILHRYFGGKVNVGTQRLRKIGKALKAQFLKKLPALGKLIRAVTAASKRGHLIGLDGRRVPIRHEHAALNTLLQGGGGLVCKRWLMEFDRLLCDEGLRDEVRQMAWIHDEVQLSVHKSLIILDDAGKPATSSVGDLCIEAIRRAGNHFKLRVPLSGEYIIGKDWAECH